MKNADKLHTLLLALLSCFYAGMASASDAYIPYAASVSVIGQSGGKVYLFTSQSFSMTNCTIQQVSSLSYLQGHVTVYGSSGVDVVQTSTGTGTICGVTVSPFSTNGFRLLIKGGGGGDALSNAFTGGVEVYGEAGGDILSNYAGWEEGGDDDDLFYMDGGDTANGGAGNDTFYVSSGYSATSVFGGPGSADKLCGSSAYVDPDVEYPYC